MYMMLSPQWTGGNSAAGNASVATAAYDPKTGTTIVSQTVNGNTYSCAVGDYIAVPNPDAGLLLTNGWAKNGDIASGPTAQRPTGVCDGYKYFDTTLGQLVTWNAQTGDGAFRFANTPPAYPTGCWRNGGGAVV